MLLSGGINESLKQRMGPVGAGFQFRMCLGGDKEGVVFQLDHLYDASVRGEAGQSHAAVSEDLAVIIIDFIAVAVAFIDSFGLVQLISL